MHAASKILLLGAVSSLLASSLVIIFSSRSDQFDVPVTDPFSVDTMIVLDTDTSIFADTSNTLVSSLEGVDLLMIISATTCAPCVFEAHEFVEVVDSLKKTRGEIRLEVVVHAETLDLANRFAKSVEFNKRATTTTTESIAKFGLPVYDNYSSMLAFTGRDGIVSKLRFMPSGAVTSPLFKRSILDIHFNQKGQSHEPS